MDTYLKTQNNNNLVGADPRVCPDKRRTVKAQEMGEHTDSSLQNKITYFHVEIAQSSRHEISGCCNTVPSRYQISKILYEKKWKNY